MGYLQVLMVLNKRTKPDPHDAALAFGQALEKMNCRAGKVNVDTIGHQLRIRSGDVTGITDVNVGEIDINFNPSSPGQLGIINVEVKQHPDDVESAAQLAEELVKRVSEAFDIELRKAARQKRKRNNSYDAIYQVSGWQGQFNMVAVTYKPQGGAS